MMLAILCTVYMSKTFLYDVFNFVNFFLAVNSFFLVIIYYLLVFTFLKKKIHNKFGQADFCPDK